MAEAPATQSQTPAPAQQQPAQAAEPAAPSGLEKVYKDFNVEDAAATFQPQQPQSQPQPAQQSPQAPAPQAFKVPDPFDPNFPAYQAQVAGQVTTLTQAVNDLSGKLSAQERQFQARQTEADIKRAVGVITEKAGIEPEIAEVALEAKARQDPRFLKIWNNRTQNPRAFEAAMQAVASEFQQKYTARQDPQLVENQRAVAASRNQMATTTKEDANAEWAGMTAGERQAKVRALINRG